MKLHVYSLALMLLGGALVCPPTTHAAKIDYSGTLTGTIEGLDAVPAEGEFEFQIPTSGFVTNIGDIELLVAGVFQIDTNLDVTAVPPTTFIAETEDGDTYHGIIRWHIEQAGGGVYDVAAEIIVQGGTGRFKSAKGKGTVVGTASAITRTVTIEFEGTLNGVKQPKKPKKPKKSKNAI